MNDVLQRRQFISALAASVVAVGCPLPLGFPKEPLPEPIILQWTIHVVTLDNGTVEVRVGDMAA